MKSRKFTALLLAAAFCLLTACSGGAPDDASQTSSGASSAVSSEAVSSEAVSSEASSEAASSEAAKPTADREGNEITVPDTVERIVSTAPSNTEVLVALGLADKLVAIDKYSADVEGLPEGVPQIDFRNADAEAIVELSPDLLIASGHNKVDGEDPYALLKEAGICVAYIPSSDSIQGICDDILFIGALTGETEKAQSLADEYQKQIADIKAVAAGIPEEEKKTVYFEIMPAPDLYSFGAETFLNEFIEAIGAKNIFAGETGWLAPSAEAILEANPDVILTNVNFTEDPIGEILSREGWDAITAVKEKAVYPIDTNASSRPSQLSVKALLEMAKAVYPEYYD